MDVRQLYYDVCRKYYFNKLLEREPQTIQYRTLKKFIEDNFPDNKDEYEVISEDSEEKALSDFEYYS